MITRQVVYQKIMKAKDVLGNDETALVLFTDGLNLTINKDDGTASSGNWIMENKITFDRVIIFKKDRERNQNLVYVGTPVEIIAGEGAGRFVIKMSDVKCVGRTDENWNGFTETKKGATNPVQYIR